MESAPYHGNVTVRLVKLFCAEPALWDKDYGTTDLERRRRDRTNAFKRIAIAMANSRAGVKDVTLKIKNIRKIFKQERIKKVRQQRLFRAAERNAATPPPYVSKYPWFAMLDEFTSSTGNAKRRPTSSLTPEDVPLSILTNKGTSSGAGNAECRRTPSPTPEDIPSSTEDFTPEEKVPSSNAHNNGNMSTEPSLLSIVSMPLFEQYLNAHPVQSVVDQFVSYIEGWLEKMTPNVAAMALKEINDEVIKHKLMEFNLSTC